MKSPKPKSPRASGPNFRAPKNPPAEELVEVNVEGAVLVPSADQEEFIGNRCTQFLASEPKDADYDRTPTRWGNPEGLGFRDDMDRMKWDIEGLTESENGRYKIDHVKQDEIFNANQQELKLMKQDDFPKFLNLRERFLSTYVREFRHHAFTEKDRNIIQKASASVHEGDPVYDALIFRQHLRKDPDLYVELYGVAFEQAFSMRNDRQTMTLLASHATAKSSTSASIPETFFQSFQKVVTLLRERDWPEDPRKDSTVDFALNKYWLEWHAIQWRKTTSKPTS